MQFMGKDTIALCKQMKNEFPIDGATAFIEHITDGRGGEYPFSTWHLRGTMGLNKDGPDRATVTVPDPPKGMTRNQMLQHSRD
jgi:hypothetical protein